MHTCIILRNSSVHAIYLKEHKMIKGNARWRNWLQIIYLCVVSYHEYLCTLRRKINRQVRYILQNLPLCCLRTMYVHNTVVIKFAMALIFLSVLVYFFSYTIICLKQPCIHCWIIPSWNYINLIVLCCNIKMTPSY